MIIDIGEIIPDLRYTMKQVGVKFDITIAPEKDYGINPHGFKLKIHAKNKKENAEHTSIVNVMRLKI